MGYSPGGSLVSDPKSNVSPTDDNQGFAVTNEVITNEMMDGSVDEQVYTLDEALTMVGFGKFQVLVLVYAGLGTMAESMEVMILSFIGPAVKSEWGLASGQESLITSVVFAGMLIGAYSWGLISDNCGRRIGLLSIAVVTSTFAMFSAFSPNFVLLVLCRLVVGIGLGGGPIYSTWFLEFVPVQNRGIWMVIFSTFWTFGTMLEASLVWIIMPRLGWRWLLLLSSVPCFGALVFYFLTVESPRYLYMNGRITDAHNILRKMAVVNRKDLPSGTLVCDQMAEVDEEFTPSEDAHFLSAGRKNITNKRGFSSILTLLSSTLLKTTLLLWVVFFGNTFSYYGVVLLTSELSSSQSKCSLIKLHSHKLMDSNIYINLFITSFAELPGLILAAVIVDKIGRRISMVLMYSFCFIFLLPLMFHENELLTTCLLFGARMCIIGAFTVAGIYCPEIYPTSVRSTGYGVANSVGRIAGMICPLVAVGLVSSCHQIAAIILFELAIVLAGIGVMFLPIETRGKELNDIVGTNS